MEEDVRQRIDIKIASEIRAIAFAGMALNNVLLYVDTVIAPNVDWSIYPNLIALASVVILLYALIWDT